MRTIHRDIVGGYIFSKDGKLLLGKNCKGGVYEGQFVVPAGGMEEGETKEMTLHREILEETGIDISVAKIVPFYDSTGEHEKTLRETGERVFVKMNFYDFRIDLNQNTDEVEIKTDDDWSKPRWFEVDELDDPEICEPTRRALIEKGIAEV
jgi:nucleoside triphosphatase